MRGGVWGGEATPAEGEVQLGARRRRKQQPFFQLFFSQVVFVLCLCAAWTRAFTAWPPPHPMTHWAPGSVLGGRYEVTRVLDGASLGVTNPRKKKTTWRADTERGLKLTGPLPPPAPTIAANRGRPPTPGSTTVSLSPGVAWIWADKGACPPTPHPPFPVCRGQRQAPLRERRAVSLPIFPHPLSPSHTQSPPRRPSSPPGMNTRAV